MSTPGDLLFHVRAERLDQCFALAFEITDRLRGAVTVRDEVHGFKYFDMRDALSFVDGTENPVGAEASERRVGCRKCIRTQRRHSQTGYDQPPSMLLFVLYACLRVLIDLALAPLRHRAVDQAELLVLREHWLGLSAPQGKFRKLGVEVSASAIRRVLRQHRVPPAPRRFALTWRRFLVAHASTIVATDFFSVDTVFLKRLYILFFIHLGSRRILFAACTESPGLRLGYVAFVSRYPGLDEASSRFILDAGVVNILRTATFEQPIVAA